jgi:hypothetical protein
MPTEMNGMKIWSTTSDCVRLVKIFRLMSLRQKSHYLGAFLSPALITFIAVARSVDAHFGLYWYVIAAFLWLLSISQAISLLRGALAERKGVSPAGPGERGNIEFQKASLKLTTRVAVVCGCVALIGFAVFGLRDRTSATLLAFPAVWMLQASTYTANLFQGASFD